MKKLTYLLPLGLLLVGCASSDELNYANSQVSRLKSKVTMLESELASVKKELAVAKNKRVVRLPTGAPTVVEPRRPRLAAATADVSARGSGGNDALSAQNTAMNTTAPTNVTESNGMVSGVASTSVNVTPSSGAQSTDMIAVEQGIYRQAIAEYQSGNVARAASTLSSLLSQYPTTTYRPKALFALGQSNYVLRRYLAAQKPLEQLVKETPRQQLNPNAVALLKKVYLSLGKQGKVIELENYMQQSRGVQQSVAPLSTTTAPSASTSVLSSGSSISAPESTTDVIMERRPY